MAKLPRGGAAGRNLTEQTMFAEGLGIIWGRGLEIESWQAV